MISRLGGSSSLDLEVERDTVDGVHVLVFLLVLLLGRKRGNLAATSSMTVSEGVKRKKPPDSSPDPTGWIG